MSITPDVAKSMTETTPHIQPVFSEKGVRKGQYLEKSYRYQFPSAPERHIAIMRTGTKDGITAYINNISVSGSAYSLSEIDGVIISETYHKGHEGKAGKKGISGSVARLQTLDPKKNDVHRLSISSKLAFKNLLDWYFGKELKPSISLTSELNLSRNLSFENVLTKTLGDNKQNLPSESLEALKIVAKKIDDEYKNKPGMDIDAIVKRRVGQSEFRSLLETRDGSYCHVSRIDNRKLLIASHIVPWSRTEKDEEKQIQIMACC